MNYVTILWISINVCIHFYNKEIKIVSEVLLSIVYLDYKKMAKVLIVTEVSGYQQMIFM